MWKKSITPLMVLANLLSYFLQKLKSNQLYRDKIDTIYLLTHSNITKIHNSSFYLYNLCFIYKTFYWWYFLVNTIYLQSRKRKIFHFETIIKVILILVRELKSMNSIQTKHLSLILSVDTSFSIQAMILKILVLLIILYFFKLLCSKNFLNTFFEFFIKVHHFASLTQTNDTIFSIKKSVTKK